MTLQRQIEYIVGCIGAFAERFGLINRDAYLYLKEHKELDFLMKHYEIEHTQSIDWAVDDLVRVCQKHGGKLA